LGIHYNATLQDGTLTIHDAQHGLTVLEYGATGQHEETHHLYDLHLDVRGKSLLAEFEQYPGYPVSPISATAFSIEIDSPVFFQLGIGSGQRPTVGRRFIRYDFEQFGGDADLADVSGIIVRFPPPWREGPFAATRISIVPAQSDVTSIVSVNFNRPQRTHELGTITQRVTIQNNSNVILASPLNLVLLQLQDGVNLLNATEMHFADNSGIRKPGIEIPLGTDGVLTPGEFCSTRLVFRLSSGSDISFQPLVKAVLP